MMATDAQLGDRLAAVCERIAAAAMRSGRSPASVRLVPASKTQPVDVLRDAYACGLREFAENRVQELAEKAAQLPRDVTWHMIGSLQRNKVRRAVEHAGLIQSVDGVRLAEAIGAIARERGSGMRVLLEVKTSNERTKHGFAPEEILRGARAVAAVDGLILDGLMTLGPSPEPGASGPDERATRAAFAMLRRCAQEVAAAGIGPMRELSMGMSGDFEWAIEEGATIVRVGTSLFGPRRS
jgi:hypothetical protein